MAPLALRHAADGDRWAGITSFMETLLNLQPTSILPFLEQSFKSHGQRFLYQFLRFLSFYGVLAFFAQAIVSFWGEPLLGNSFEWPIGMVSGVVVDSQGHYIAPHASSGRIQIYDAENKYVRGWFVKASGGALKLRLIDGDKIEVVTQRGQDLFVFASDGTLIRHSTSRPRTYADIFPESSIVRYFDTPWILLPFAHPVIAWSLTIFSGVLGVILEPVGVTRKL